MLPLAKNSVLVLPGGRFQVPLIQKARALGYWTVCADRDGNCAGSLEADEFHSIGLNEEKQLLELARTIQPVGIVTDQTDAGVKVVARLAENLKLPGIGTRCAQLYTDKSLMREFGRSHGFATPDFRLCLDLGSAQSAARELSFPLVLKPIDNQSSKGVHRVNNAEELAARWPDAWRHTTGETVLLEQFVDGVEFTAEGFMGANRHRTLGISEKRHYRECPMVACSLQYTPANNRFDYEELRCAHDAWVEESGLPFGMTHAEYKFARGRYYMIEVAARGGGTRIASDIVPWISGVDSQEWLLASACGNAPDPTNFNLAGRCALLEFFHFPPGRILSIKGVEKTRRMPGVREVIFGYEVGDSLPSVTNDTTRQGHFILLTDTESELLALREQVLHAVRVETESCR